MTLLQMASVRPSRSGGRLDLPSLRPAKECLHEEQPLEAERIIKAPALKPETAPSDRLARSPRRSSYFRAGRPHIEFLVLCIAEGDYCPEQVFTVK